MKISIPQPYTLQEQRLKTYVRLLFFIYAGGMLLYMLPGITFIPDFLKPYNFINDPAFANNSTIKMALFAVVCFIAAADVRRFRAMIEILMFVMMFGVLSGIILAIFMNNNYIIHMSNGSELTMRTMILLSSLFDFLLGIILIRFTAIADKARYELQYLSPMQFRSLQALAQVVIEGDQELVTAKEVAHNVDRYLASFKGKSKWTFKLALSAIEIYPLFFLKPPSSYLNPADRKKFLERQFYQTVAMRLSPPFIRAAVQLMIRMAKQLCFMGYYNDSRTFESVGYIPFSKRADLDERLKTFPVKPRKPLYVMNEPDIKNDVITADVVIIGTGPGGSVLAKGLIEQGRSVLMIERGNHTDPIEFNESEVDMVSKLYADGALQLAADFKFQVIQGNCVGGSSVVNNAVCFDTPDYVLDRWNDTNGLNAGLDLDRYKKSNAKVNTMIGVQKVPTMTVDKYLNPGGQKFEQGCRAMGLDKAPNKMDSVAANICGCLGCGYCNMGCRYGKKLSMLDTILPETQEKHGRDALQIIAGCEAWKIKSRGGKISSVTGKFNNGRKVEIKANTFVVAAGAISSSILLLRSNIATGRAGKNLAFNVGSPMTSVFPDVINSYDGLQISHYLQVNPNRGYIFETWFNPPMFQSTVMPGWWNDHYKNMLRYNRMACTGVLAASESNAEVRLGGLTGRDIVYEPTKRDFETLLDGLILAGEIYLNAGAECVMPNSFKYYEFKTTDELRRLKELIKDNSDINLGTGHPQGGNIISMDAKRGVVDNEMKVHGYSNLFVCDASVFPTSVGVNPQITVMAVADYAVPFVAACKN